MPKPKLTPVAELVLNHTDAPFRYLTPTSPDRKFSNNKISSSSHHTAPRTIDPRVDKPVIERNVDAFKKNAQVHRPAPKPALNSSVTIKSEGRAGYSSGEDVIAVVPKSGGAGTAGAVTTGVDIPTAEEKPRFVTMPPPPSVKEPEITRKRKREESPDDIALDFDQRQKAEASLDALQNQLLDIFEAEDALQPDTSGLISTTTGHVFMSNSTDENEIPVLTPNIHIRLEQAIRKVIDVDYFKHVAVEHLTRIQKLCEGAVVGAESLSLFIGDGWNESDVEEWARRLETAENGLQAAKILLRIMTAGREEKQLYSQDMVQAILNDQKNVVDACLIPVIETRSSNDTFSILTGQKKLLSRLLQAAGRLLRLLGDLITKVDVAEDVITTMEFLCSRLIFVENAPLEKDSVLGIQKFEGVRRIAMDVMAQIFARYPAQRHFIFDEILTSLEKLPVTRQSARQFKLSDGKPIQLVSALLMRLVQTSGSRTTKQARENLERAVTKDEDSDDDDSDSESNFSSKPAYNQRKSSVEPDGLSGDLLDLCKPLHDNAQSNSSYVVKFMVQRALTSTKSGDQPYRNLLDIFTEDFLNVLGNTDWPAAELLLRSLLQNMVGLMENDKSTAPAKTMALDLMGIMGSGICDLRVYLRHHKTTGTDQSVLTPLLLRLADDYHAEKISESDLLSATGPYRLVVEYLCGRDFNFQDRQLQSAQGYYLTVWAKQICTALEATDGEVYIPERLPSTVSAMIKDPRWLETHQEFDQISTVQGRFASTLITLNLPFCRALNKIFAILLSSMNSDQATVKSKSLKSLVQLLEKDPEILERGNYIINHIVRCTVDPSPLVRDSALTLLGRCLQLRPSLEDDVCERIIQRSADAAVGVRKRAMKILKEIYLRNESQEIKAAIADALLQRVKDADESVAEIARQTFEEVWMTPFHAMNTGKADAVQSKLALQRQISLIVRTAQRGEAVLSVLEPLLRSILSSESKNDAANFKVCKAMVAQMFDGIIENNDSARGDMPKQQHILQTLTVFAKAKPRLFTGEQLQLLEPYVKHLSNNDDLLIYRSVIVIFRHVMPTLSSFQNTFLKAVQDALLINLSKLGKTELSEVATCLWTIDSVLKNTERLIRLVISVLSQVHTIKEKNLNFKEESSQVMLNKLKRFIVIAGHMGRACDFEPFAETFKNALSWWKGTSVAALIVDMICPFTSQKHPIALRETAFEAIGTMCETWPKQYVRRDVIQALELVFINEDTKLEYIVLTGFRTFLSQEEMRSESGATIAVGEGAVHGAERLGTSLVANDNDGASTQLAQRFLTHILRIALATVDELALIATQVIASVNRQGLVHPKECGPSLVALETSSNTIIANIAFQEHKVLYQKHESMFEKEHMKAVYQAYEYQRDVFKDPLGATKSPVQAKLKPFWEVMKLGNGKSRKKFLVHICSKLDFDLSRLRIEPEGEPQGHLMYTRFCMENLALFDYPRVDELLQLVTTMEKIVTKTGAIVAHAIETDILKLTSAQVPQLEMPQDQEHAISPFPNEDLFATPQEVSPPDPERLRLLSMAAVTLSLIWETRTFLRRLWSLQKPKDGKAKPSVKDLNRAPTRAQFISVEKELDVIEAIAKVADDPGSRLATCKAFVDLMAVDNELKLGSDDDELDTELLTKGYETPDEDGENSAGTPGTGSRGRKQKGPSSAQGTPSNRKRKRPPSKNRKPSKKFIRSGSSASPGVENEWE